MAGYKLPLSLSIGERVYPVNYGWQNAIEILIDFQNPEYTHAEKVASMLRKLLPDWMELPSEHIQEAIEKACAFLDCGRKPDDRHRPRIMDWEQDAEIIIPAVNHVAGTEVRLNPDIHWWTFFGWYMSIGEGLFATVLRIRGKKSKGKKLEKWEEEFFRENKHLIELHAPETDEMRKEKDNILKWLNGGG